MSGVAIRLLRSLATTFVMVAAAHAEAASLCGPPREIPDVRLVAMHPKTTEDYAVSRTEMNRVAAQIGATAAARAAHPLMLIIAQAVSQVEIQHRAIAVRNGEGGRVYCDVPISVVVVFGAFGRKVLILAEAAADPCVRRALLDHQSQHNRALDEQIDTFVDRHRADLRATVQHLTVTAAPDEETATKGFEAHMAEVVTVMMKQFRIEIDHAREEVDSASALDLLRQACSGKIRQLEQELIWPGNGQRAWR